MKIQSILTIFLLFGLVGCSVNTIKVSSNHRPLVIAHAIHGDLPANVDLNKNTRKLSSIEAKKIISEWELSKSTIPKIVRSALNEKNKGIVFLENAVPASNNNGQLNFQMPVNSIFVPIDCSRFKESGIECPFSSFIIKDEKECNNEICGCAYGTCSCTTWCGAKHPNCANCSLSGLKTPWRCP